MINLIKAFVLMFKSHYGQKDKGGKPYIFHPLIVSMNVKGYDEKIVALLHDIFEDTDIKLEDVNFLTDKQRETLKLLTHNPDQSYTEYIKSLQQNPIAKAVKLSDLKHNSNLKRINSPTKKDIERQQKYLMYYELLKKKVSSIKLLEVKNV